MAYYKAFEKGLICRGKQYAENTIFEEQGADRCCTEGVMHFCKEPFDTLKYYPLVDGNGDFSEFAIIEPLDDIIEESYKCASKKIRIKEKLTFSEFIKKAVAKINGKRNDGPKPSISTTSRDFARIGSSGDYARIGSSGYGARIGSSGYGARICSSGYGAQIGSIGDGARIGSSGYGAQIGSIGDGARIGSSGYGAQIGSCGYGSQISSGGDFAQIGSSGDYTQISSGGFDVRIGSSGDYARIGSSGDYARINMTGERSVASCVGYRGTIKGTKGCWIVLTEWQEVDNKMIPVCVKCGQIDGKILKENVFYTLKNGEFVEEEEDQ